VISNHVSVRELFAAICRRSQQFVDSGRDAGAAYATCCICAMKCLAFWRMCVYASLRSAILKGLSAADRMDEAVALFLAGSEAGFFSNIR